MASTPMNAGLPTRPVPGTLLRRTVITNGAGTFAPLFQNVKARVVAQGAGAGGSGYAGAVYPAMSGDMVDVVLHLQGPVTYSVGAGGIGSTGAASPGDGGATTFGAVIAFGGVGVTNNNNLASAAKAARASGGVITQGGYGLASATSPAGINSLYGFGGAANGGTATGYGAGGGALSGGTGGNGSGGLIIIEEYAE